jgi:hypothetical protein
MQILAFLFVVVMLFGTGFTAGYLWAGRDVRRWTYEEWDRLDRQRSRIEPRP